MVSSFWTDRTPVTNRKLRAFGQAVGYLAVAEIAPDPKGYQGTLPRMFKLASLVFTLPRHVVDRRDWSRWWEFGTNWRCPYRRGRSNHGLDEPPVVHVAYKGAEAYATWASKALLTGAQW
jgi:formylglycine-generating enzyme